MGSIGVFEAENEIELQVFYEKVSREIKNSYLKYESGVDAKRGVIIQEKIKGKEYGLDVINDLQGDLKSVIVKKK